MYVIIYQISIKLGHLVVNDCWKGKVVEYFGTISPYSDGTVLSETFVVKTIDLGDLPGLVISADECYPIGISDLELVNFYVIKNFTKTLAYNCLFMLNEWTNF